LNIEADRARKYYESAKWLMELIEEDSRAALWVLVEIYSRLLQKITDRNYDVLTERVRLTLWEKLKVLGRGFLAPDRHDRRYAAKNSCHCGGGLAGLAAGCALADAGLRVTLFERRRNVGGRASSYEHPGRRKWSTTASTFSGCCTNLIQFYERLGEAGRSAGLTKLTFIEPGDA